MDIELLEHKLNDLEQKFGGLVQKVKRNVISEKEKNYYNIHQGGDRMNSVYHNYSKIYSKFFHSKINEEMNIAEVGILTGIGIAIWCEIFKNSKIYGFDIDTNIFNKNKVNLIDKGAFKSNQPIINYFDQFNDNTDYIKNITNSVKFDIVIDDGCHLNDAILKTFKSFLPNLKKKFIYIIEDNKNVHKILRNRYPQFDFFYNDQMTVIVPKNLYT
jgi:hypothetical protein